MFSFKLEFKDEVSPADENMVSLFVKVEFEHDKMEGILDISEYFGSLDADGFYPIFTCDCGNFGCGGYYIFIKHEGNGIVLENSYFPSKTVDVENVLKTFKYEIDWEDVCFIGRELVSKIVEIKEKYSNMKICCGTFGMNISDKVKLFESKLGSIREKYC